MHGREANRGEDTQVIRFSREAKFVAFDPGFMPFIT